MREIPHVLAIGLGMLQATPPAASSSSATPTLTQVIATAGALASLAVLIYRLGVWRQEIANAKHAVGTDVVRHREEIGRSIERLERRLALFEQFIAAAGEQRVASERWQARVETKLEGHARELATAVDRLERIEARTSV